MTKGLAYIGKIIGLDPIPNADNIVLATVICGAGGKWKGVVRKIDFNPLDKCIVFLPDAIVPECEELKFMEKSNWRVRMQKFRGMPSEVVIVPHPEQELQLVGEDITEKIGVIRYIKPVPSNMNGIAKGEFPNWIPKTDELDWQRCSELVEKMSGRAYYVSQKYDGTSSTAYKRHGIFGVCSRNWELEKDEKNGYWEVAIKYRLEEKLPDGIALQWETCGPNIQLNPLRLKDLNGYAFSAYNIYRHEYLDFYTFRLLCKELEFPMVKIIEQGDKFDDKIDMYALARGVYDSGLKQEGVVVRSLWNGEDGKPLSFKVINLDYDNT